MNLYETFSLALKNIRGSKMRTFLTMLGIIIGVTAVMVIVGLGDGMKHYMTDSFASMGTNTLQVSIIGRGTSRTVSVEEVYQIVADHSDLLKDVSPTLTYSEQVKLGTETLSETHAAGVNEAYFEMCGHDIALGRGLQYIDVEKHEKVCVIGSYVAQTYFGGDPIGQTLRVGGEKLTVVGVMAQEAKQMEKGGDDDVVYLPYTTAAQIFGIRNIPQYTISVVDETQAVAARLAVENALYQIYRDENAYRVVSLTELLEMMNTMINLEIGILSIIAGISLLVGGIGIMNIMLVSVTERTKEIGIRKALGAKESVILRQFVIEAATTSGMGGILGIVVGYLISKAASPLISAMYDAPMTITPSTGSVVMAFAISTGIGILFGYLPARKAARLNPIDALRFE